MTFDCQTCGACCYGPDQYVAVTTTDLCRLLRRDVSRYVARGSERTWMKMRNGHCVALRARQGHFSCRVYGTRPNVCQVVQEGSRECLDARRRRGV